MWDGLRAVGFPPPMARLVLGVDRENRQAECNEDYRRKNRIR